MESSSPAATMAPPPPPASKSRSRDPLLFGSFALPAGWGCRRPMAFCSGDTDDDAHVVVSEPVPNSTAAAAAVAAAAQPHQNEGARPPAKGAAAAEQALQKAPRRQWNLRDRTSCWRDYRAEDDARRPLPKKLGGGNTEAGGGGRKSHYGFSVPLTRQEIDADFIAITGRKPPRRPTKRPKAVQRQIESLCPGSSLAEVTRDRYKVNKKGGF